MIFHYVGKYNGDENSLPHREIPEDAVQVKEMENLTIASILGNIGQTILLLLMWKWFNSIRIGDTGLLIGIIAALLIFIPHEMLHAVCFQGDVYLYTNLKRAMCFVIGTEDMSFARYLFMGLCPYSVFSHLLFICSFRIWRELVFLGHYVSASVSWITSISSKRCFRFRKTRWSLCLVLGHTGIGKVLHNRECRIGRADAGPGTCRLLRYNEE